MQYHTFIFACWVILQVFVEVTHCFYELDGGAFQSLILLQSIYVIKRFQKVKIVD